MPSGRHTEYRSEVIAKTREYLELCKDKLTSYHKTRGDKSDSYERIVNVKIPTIEGLAVYLKVHRDTIYEWEKHNPLFADILNELRAEQADRLINNGLSGNYNPTIAKVLLTKHGYREGLDQTTNDKDLPTPITQLQRNDLQRDNSVQENSGAE